MAMSHDVPKHIAALGEGVIAARFSRRQEFLRQAAGYQRLLDLLQSETALSDAEHPQILLVPGPDSTILAEMARSIAEIAERLSALELGGGSSPDRIHVRVGTDSSDVPDADDLSGAEDDVIDMTRLIRPARPLESDPVTLRSLADLEEPDQDDAEASAPADVVPDEVAEPAPEEPLAEAAQEDAVARTLYGIVLPSVVGDGEIDFLGVSSPANDLAIFEKIVRDARAAFDAGTTKAPWGGHYKYRWRRNAWLAAQALWAKDTVTTSAVDGATVEQAGDDVDAVQTPAAVEDSTTVKETVQEHAAAPVVDDLKKLPPNQETRIVVANLLRERFPEGAHINQIIAALSPEYDIKGKNPNYWWLLMSEGPFDLHEGTGNWTLSTGR